MSGRELDNLADAVSAGQIGPAGQFLARFERQIAEFCGAAHAVTTCSGTAAAHIALLLAGVGPGQEVITTAWTFVATGNAIRHAGAHPVVLDVEPDHWQLDPAELERFLTGPCTRTPHGLLNPDTGRIVTAVMPVHLLGHPADLDPIRALTEAHGLALVCDAAQAIGATHRGRPIGAPGLSAVSFNANKIITTGGGGAILTDDAGLADRARYLINQAREHPVEYRHGEVGFNYRMTNLQAAIGCAQLERIESFIAAKRATFDRYAEALADLDGVRFQAEAAWAHTTRWFTTCLIAPERSATTAPQLRARLADADIAAGPPWTPLHLTGAHRHTAPWPSPVAETLGRNAIHLPCSVGMTHAQQDRVIDAVRSAVPPLRRT
ncbi:aminotransferase class I/II-fold pyridoxal phosphate-dependent enzyme [Spirillospora sp. NPDC052269]